MDKERCYAFNPGVGSHDPPFNISIKTPSFGGINNNAIILI
jgi:hypothetical protein